MHDHLVFADIAGHIVIDVEAAREAEKREDEPDRPAPEKAKAEDTLPVE